MIVVRLPSFGQGARIGVYGGSFNPAHEGHKLVCDVALRRLELDQIWILPTPGNPMKPVAALAPLASRIEALKRLELSPKIKILDLEQRIHTHYTIDLLRFILTHSHGAHFVWLMGADNLIQFSQWRNWREIAALTPIAIIDRPGSGLLATASKAAHALARWRLPEHAACDLPTASPPAWVFIHDRRSAAASTNLRADSLTFDFQ